jgi:phosphoribosylaminoimidazolecarboxamide formyltransferase / IMP cyclohydrolase
MSARIQIKRALISVYNKDGIVNLAASLVAQGCEILSTGGTAALLRNSGIAVCDVSEVTSFPEMMNGRVKTLHPRIHGGLLARRNFDEDLQKADEHGIPLIDLVIVTLYPFDEVAKNPDSTLEELVENIDIGGPSMLRSAAKNHRDVTVVSDSKDYDRLLDEVSSGGTTKEFRREMAAKTFARTAAYDGLIATTLAGKFEQDLAEENPTDNWTAAPFFSQTLPRFQELRYGENPHQQAAVYGSLDGLDVLHGKPLSYNNLLDVDAALELIKDFPACEETACAILKHTNPCGVAVAENAAKAYNQAFATDTLSPFGGIVIWNKRLDLEAATEVNRIFTEIILAPGFDEDAFKLLRKKKNRRILKFDQSVTSTQPSQIRHFFGGLLAQGYDNLAVEDIAVYACVTKRKPDAKELADMLFTWKVVRHVKSNAIVLATGGRTLGIGAGQMSRVDASEVAVMKATKEQHNLNACALGSDAFFPFADGIEAAAKAGVTSVIQPGGSMRDAEVIEAADKFNMCMLFTSKRHFRH